MKSPSERGKSAAEVPDELQQYIGNEPKFDNSSLDDMLLGRDTPPEPNTHTAAESGRRRTVSGIAGKLAPAGAQQDGVSRTVASVTPIEQDDRPLEEANDLEALANDLGADSDLEETHEEANNDPAVSELAKPAEEPARIGKRKVPETAKSRAQRMALISRIAASMAGRIIPDAVSVSTGPASRSRRSNI